MQVKNYPTYRKYQDRKITPSVLSQNFHCPTLDENEVYYPENLLLTSFFSNEKESQMFGAASFCSFLGDTIAVEHELVIPAITKLRRIPYKLPREPLMDLFQTATDECHHAQQSLVFLSQLETHFGLQKIAWSELPLFLRRLEGQIQEEENPLYKDLLPILNGIVTETRISVELGQFSRDERLSSTVREICEEHAVDEGIHASQFKALARWLWEEFDEETKVATSKFLIRSTISRSLPDLDSIAESFCTATGRTLKEAMRMVLEVYTPEAQIKAMLDAGKPTKHFLNRHLGLDQYADFDAYVGLELEKLEVERNQLLKS